jgi:hypothetical protein
MRGVGFRPRIAVQPQPILCGSDGVGETKRSALSPGRINIARACWDRTGYVLLARALMGLSRQLPILQLRPMHGHRERYCFLLRDQSPVLVRAPAARRLSGSILRRSLPRHSTCILLIHCGITATGPTSCGSGSTSSATPSPTCAGLTCANPTCAARPSVRPAPGSAPSAAACSSGQR